MYSLRNSRGLLARLPHGLHSSACQASSSLEKFIAGTYDPVAESKKQERPNRGNSGEEGRHQQGGRFNRFNQQSPGGEARRQALGHARQRASQGQYGAREESRDGRGQGWQPQGYGRGRGGRSGRGQHGQQHRQRDAFGPYVEGSGAASNQFAGDRQAVDALDDFVDEEVEDVAPASRGRRSNQAGRRAPAASMMGTITDSAGVMSGRFPGASGRGRIGADGFGRGRGRGRGMGMGRGRGMGAARGRDAGRQGGRGRRHLAPLGEEDPEGEAGTERQAPHPEDMLEGIRDEETWNMIEETRHHEADVPVNTPSDPESHAYIFDQDGITVEKVWENMSYEELRTQLLMEMTYSRHDHEAWLRGAGRPDLEAVRMEAGMGAFTEEEFEEEVEMQMELFNRYTWIDDLYFFAKEKQTHEKAAKARVLGEAELAEMNELYEGAEAGALPQVPAAAGDFSKSGSSQPVQEVSEEVLKASAESTAAGSNAEAAPDAGGAREDEQAAAAPGEEQMDGGRSGAAAGGAYAAGGAPLGEQGEEVVGDQPAQGEDDAEVDAQLKAWMTENTRRSMRETRMLRKFWGIRETARVGIVPRRKGAEFNKQEFDAVVLDKMMDMLEPDRPRNLQGNFLSERQAIDAKRAVEFDCHPEMLPHFVRPELFPAFTLESMSREAFDKRMDSMRDDIDHPMAGLHSEDDWQELKDRTFEKLPELMQNRIKMHQRVGFSGLMGGFREERAYLEAVAKDIMPEGHPNEGPMATYVAKIASNPQWAWPYKIQGVALTAKYLMVGSDFAEERRRAHEEGGGNPLWEMFQPAVTQDNSAGGA